MVWILVAIIILLSLRVPVFVTLLTVSLGYVLFEPSSMGVIVQRMSSGLESFPLLAIPFFVLAGSIMARGGLAEKLMDFAGVLVGHFRGGLAQVNVLNSLFIGGMSGSANADAAIDAKVLVPLMRKRGYSNSFASAISAASSTIAPILPPSIGLILYGVLAGVSIGDLFIGGIIPAFMIAIALMVTVRILSVRHGFPRERDRISSAREVWATFKRSIAALLMPILLIVGLRIGLFTPTELGAIAVLYALFVSLVIYRQITWRDLPAILRDATVTTGIVMIIIAAASVFGIVVAYERIPEQLEGLLQAVSSNPLVVLLVINILLLIIGTFMDSMSVMIILAPMMAPMVADMGVDPVHFGLIVVINLTLGSVTPPIGSVLFTVTAITGVKLGEFTKAFLPLFLALLVVLLLVTYVPGTVTWLPGMF